MPEAQRQTEETRAPREVVFEQPLTERMRTLLRLELLFEQLAHQNLGDSAWDTRAAVNTLIEISSLLARGDVRSEVLKELERHALTLGRLQNRDDVNRERLSRVLNLLGQIHKELDTQHRPLGQGLKDNEFLAAIRNRSSIPGGTCQFDLPGYHHWLQKPAAERREDLLEWVAELDPLRRAIKLLMTLTRESAIPESARAEDGMYQKVLEQSSNIQLIRVMLPAGDTVFPEVSAGKHRITIRFLERTAMDQRAQQVKRDIDFLLVICHI